MDEGSPEMSNNSILTNPEALVALRNLERTNRSLAITQNRVSTGLKVTGAIDDASNFAIAQRSEEHTSELQPLMRISYAVFCLKKKKINIHMYLHLLNTTTL